MRNIEFRKGHVTFQQSVYIGGVLFGVNTQHEFDQVVEIRVGCGCNGGVFTWVKHYRVRTGKNLFLIDAKNLVETNEPIPVSAQSFLDARDNQFLQNSEHHNFDSIRTNNNPSMVWQIANSQATDLYKH